MQTLYKNGCLVDLSSGTQKFVDFLVVNGKIAKIEDAGKICLDGEEVVDLQGDFVLPPFVNAFCDSVGAFEANYDKPIEKKNIVNVQNLMLIKNILAGAIVEDVSLNNSILLENVDELDEKTLSLLSDLSAKSGKRLFIKAGQTLEELGSVDKIYQKSLAQVLEDFGFLDRQPIIVGGNCFEKDDFELFYQYDCHFVLTVGEDGKFGRRPTNLIALKAKDFVVGMGSGKNGEIDFFGFMRQLLMTMRGLYEDENCLCEQEVLQIATKNGTQILTGKEKNSLKIGEEANFIVVRKGLSLYNDVFKTLVWGKSKKDVLMTVKNGEILQKNGKILMKNLPDYDTIIAKLKEN